MAVHQELPGERHPEQTRARRHVLLAQLAAPLRNFLQTEAGSAGLLLAATALALVWANSPWSDLYTDLWATSLTVRISDHELAMDLEHWVNDGLMVIFFFVVGLELRRELSVGQLTDRRALILPALGAIGGLVVPSLLYILLNPTGEASRGWGIVIGTDTAFLLGALALVGPALSTQLRVFLLTMTIIDDVFAVTIIGVFYSESVDLVALAIAIVAVAGFALLDRLNVWRTSLYGVCGLVLWIATIESGLHPSIAGVAAGLTMAAYAPRREAVERAASLFHAFRQSPSPGAGYSVKVSLQRVVSVNERLQEVLHPWTSYYIVPLFALANAGIDLRGGVLGDALQSAVTWGIVLGLVGGKVVGIGITTLGGERLRLGSFPRGVGHGHVLGGAALSGIGFTVSLLIANLAFTSSQLQAEATIGVLIAAVLSLLLGWLVFHLSALLHGEDAATLPLVLDPPVDPSRDHIRGPVNAPLTLVEYADFECPFCGEATDVIEELFERFGNDLQFVFRHLPLTDAHPRAELAALAAEAAAEQGRFWEMHDLLFEHQDALESEDLLGYAAMAGLDLDAFRDAISGEEASRRVREDVESAEASGAQGTPTFFIGSRRHTGEHDAETLARELIASLTASEVAGEH